MARVLYQNETSEDIRKSLARVFQSAHLNFLIGSGASDPAINTAGNIEAEINDLISSDNEIEANLKTYQFLAGVQKPTNKLIAGEEDENNAETLKQYEKFLGIVETILTERRTNILPKQATIFTTNYDLFMEKASLKYPSLKLNDGFNREPSLNNHMEFASRTFFNSTFNTGNLFSYKVEIPCINLIKLHGSLSWNYEGNGIVFSVEQKELLPPHKTSAQINNFIESYALVLPQVSKFRTTLMDRTYYELLRIFANELDREQTLLVAFGFSFGDEHIFEITQRALRNPTLKLMIFAFNDADKSTYAQKFDGYNNVDIIAPAEGITIDFDTFNEFICDFLPSANSIK